MSEKFIYFSEKFGAELHPSQILHSQCESWGWELKSELIFTPLFTAEDPCFPASLSPSNKK